jgi:GT2 family glycosyltransferase
MVAGTQPALAVPLVSRTPPEPQLRVCAVICTRDRPAQLRRALRSLQSQAASLAGVLVVDNSPTADTAIRTLIREEFATATYLHEPIPGLNFARNRALRAASAEVVAFLDDDAVAEPGWAAAIQTAFAADPALGACLGQVTAFSLETEGQRLFEANGGFARGEAPILLPRDARVRRGLLRTPLIAWAIGVGSGCSMAVRRRAVLDLGGFDEALEIGPISPTGGDLDLIWRLLEAGYAVRYEPAVRARHEHRRTIDAVVEQIAAHHRGLVTWLSKAVVTSKPRHRPGAVLFLAWRLCKPGLRLLLRVAGRDPLPAWAIRRVWAQCWAGVASYPAARRLAARQRDRSRSPAGSP